MSWVAGRKRYVQLRGERGVADLEALELGLDARLRDAGRHLAEHRRRRDVTPGAKVQRAAVQRADLRLEELHVLQPQVRVHHVVVWPDGGDVAVRVLRGLVEHVAAHPAGDVDHDVGLGLADALDDLGVVVELAARRPRVRLADVEVGDGGAGITSLDAGVGDLLG